MSKLSGLIKSRITENLKKNVGVFDPELPDYVVILLANGKPKAELFQLPNLKFPILLNGDFINDDIKAL